MDMPATGLWQSVESGLPFLDFLEEDDRVRLRTLARGFLAEKRFHGANGLPLEDGMLLAIALQACLPILRSGLDAYRGWTGVIVYPGDFVIPRQEIDEDGIVHEYEEAVLGEAWQGGPVLIAWFDRDKLPDGINVVIHEFAHKLDMENGGADGCPRLPPDMSPRQWAQVFTSAYAHFQAALDRGQDTLLDPYGAEHPGEFFAVASEAFFEWPCALQAEYPAVYAQLARLYGVDPAAGERRIEDEAGSGSARPQR
jgi:Mlc titration factor MtfA (ptsG expression regulator)